MASDSTITIRFYSNTRNSNEIFELINSPHSYSRHIGQDIYINNKFIRKSNENVVGYSFINKEDENFEIILPLLEKFLVKFLPQITQLSNMGWEVIVVFSCLNNTSCHIGLSLRKEIIELLNTINATFVLDAYVTHQGNK